MHNNIWDTNFPDQQAFDHVLRYTVSPSPPHCLASSWRCAPRLLPVTLSCLSVHEQKHSKSRLRSVTEAPVTCQLSTPFALTRAIEPSYLGAAGRELALGPDASVSVTVPALGTAAVALELGGLAGSMRGNALPGRWRGETITLCR